MCDKIENIFLKIFVCSDYSVNTIFSLFTLGQNTNRKLPWFYIPKSTYLQRQGEYRRLQDCTFFMDLGSRNPLLGHHCDSSWFSVLWLYFMEDLWCCLVVQNTDNRNSKWCYNSIYSFFKLKSLQWHSLVKLWLYR